MVSSWVIGDNQSSATATGTVRGAGLASDFCRDASEAPAAFAAHSTVIIRMVYAGSRVAKYIWDEFNNVCGKNLKSEI